MTSVTWQESCETLDREPIVGSACQWPVPLPAYSPRDLTSVCQSHISRILSIRVMGTRGKAE